MKASKIVHRSEIRIRVDFEYNRGWVSKLRQIADARWSKTIGAWHIPYTSEAFGQLKEVFPEVEITSLPAPVAIATKEVLQVDQMDVLADKGYHTGEQIRQCEQNGITTYVSPKEPASNDPDIFPITSFEYTNKLRCLVLKKQSILLFCSNEQHSDYKSARAWASAEKKKKSNNMRIINILTTLLCLVSCHRLDGQATLRYQKDLKQFPSYMVDFFPDTLAGIYSTSQTVDTTSECIFYIYYDLESKNTLKLQKYIEKKSIANYLASDTALVTIKTESTMYWDESKKTFYESLFKNNTQYYPVPFFETEKFEGIGVNSGDIFSTKSTSGLSTDFIIYVLESKSGLYWKGLKQNKYMPDDWKNGYSKGICINQKKGVTIYWVIIW